LAVPPVTKARLNIMAMWSTGYVFRYAYRYIRHRGVVFMCLNRFSCSYKESFILVVEGWLPQVWVAGIHSEMRFSRLL
jgi:hypothetical protein